MKLIKATVAVIISALCSSCATKVYVTELSKNAEVNSRIDGIPFRVLENYQVRLYGYSDSTSKYTEVALDDKPTSFANSDHVYLLHLSGSTFSNGKVDFVLDDDNTIKSLQIDSTSTGESALTSLGTGVKDVFTAQSERKKNAETAATTAKTLADSAAKTAASGISDKEDVFLSALDAKLSAIDAQLEVDALLPTASAIDRQKAEAKAQRSRVFANIAARRAGIPLPYPSEPFSG